MTYPKAGTQAAKVLVALIDAKGEWVSGTYFLRQLFLSQFHARIWDLENRFGWKIEHSEEVDEHGFRSYRITGQIPPEKPPKLVPEIVVVDGVKMVRMVPAETA